MRFIALLSRLPCAVVVKLTRFSLLYKLKHHTQALELIILGVVVLRKQPVKERWVVCLPVYQKGIKKSLA